MIVNAANSKLSFLNLDLNQHDVDNLVPVGQPKPFESPLIGTGETVDVTFHGPLQAGKSYPFSCSLHPNMTGQLIAV
jgi:plastocyanin